MANNWKQMIDDLRGVGMTNAQIGEAIGSTGSAVKEIQSGRTNSPRFESAVKLLALHRKNASRIRRQRRAA